MFKTPILILTFKRPDETRKTLNQILSIKPKILYVFQDGKKSNFNEDNKKLYNKTTDLIKDYQKFKCIKYLRFKKNIGQRFIAKKVLDIVFKKEKEIIFLEDDTYPKKSFFNLPKSKLTQSKPIHPKFSIKYSEIILLISP